MRINLDKSNLAVLYEHFLVGRDGAPAELTPELEKRLSSKLSQARYSGELDLDNEEMFWVRGCFEVGAEVRTRDYFVSDKRWHCILSALGRN